MAKSSVPGASRTAWQGSATEVMSGGRQALLRRELTLGIVRVELRLYRRTRTSSDLVVSQPHLLYTIRCSWSGDTLPRDPNAGQWSPRPISPRSPRKAACGRAGAHRTSGGFEAPRAWWESLPQSYTVRRRWHEIAQFHESLQSDLAFDPVIGMNRVKGKVPVLPGPADLDAWIRGYAATGDVLALGRPRAIPQELVRCHDELSDLHWTHINNRLAPYFADVNKVLLELPTSILASSRALRRFVTGGVGGRRLPSVLPLPSRFLGTQQPVCGTKEDLEAAARTLLRARSAGALTGTPAGKSEPKGTRGSRPESASRTGPSSAGAAAAKLLFAKQSSGI